MGFHSIPLQQDSEILWESKNKMTTIIVSLIIGAIAFVQGYITCKSEWDKEKLTKKD